MRVVGTGERFGPYELSSLLGRGGMGEVFRAVDTRKSRRVVALKRLPAGLAADSDFQRRFLREAELAARLRDPHVIPIHDYGEIDGQPYLDMRLVDGVDLADELRRHGPLPPERSVALLTQIADALDAAHGEGLVHRDVKPHNVLLAQPRGDEGGRDGRDFVYLIDFGIAANLLSSRRHSAPAAGTVAYMAPERFAGGGDHRVDVYALGCVLHELLTGRTPFVGEFLQLVYAHANTPPPAPSALVPSLPRELDAVVATALAKDPAQRQRTAGSLASEARRAVDAGSPGAPSTRPGTTVPRGPRPTLRAPSSPTAAPREQPGEADDRRARSAQTPPRRRRGRRSIVALFRESPDSAQQVLSRAARRRHHALLATTVLVVLAALLLTFRLLDTPVVETIAVGNGPEGVAVTSDGRRVYAVNEYDRSVSVIDTEERSVVATVPIGNYPKRIALGPDGLRAYVHDGAGSVAVIDTTTDTVAARVPVKDDLSVGTGVTDDVAVTPDGRRAYVTSNRSSSVSVIDTFTNAVTPIGLTGSPRGIAIGPDGRAYIPIGSPSGTSLQVLDTTSNAVVRAIPLPAYANGVDLSPDGRRAYLTDSYGSFSVLETISGTVTVVPVEGAATGAAVTPDGSRALVTVRRSTASAAVSVLDTGDSTVTATFGVGERLSGVVFAPDGRLAYITDKRTDSVSIVDLGWFGAGWLWRRG